MEIENESKSYDKCILKIYFTEIDKEFTELKERICSERAPFYNF